MQGLAAIALAAAAAIAVADPSSPPEAGDPPRCAIDAAIVHGPPAPELFDPLAPRAGRATWCERYDARGRRERIGTYTDEYPSGAPRARARFVDDALDGDVSILDERGEPWLRAQYDHGRLDGEYVLYGRKGRPLIRGAYRQGLAVGRHTLHHPNGAVAAETHYDEGVENGIARSYWRNGHIRRELTIVDGVWSGRVATWFENGRPESQGQYAPCPQEATASSCRTLGAARHGRWQTWHDNGQRASRGTWRFGVKVGTWVYWDEAGEPEVVQVHRGDDSMVSIRGTTPAALPDVSSSPTPEVRVDDASSP